VTLPRALLSILVCPVDKGWLLYFADEDLLYNPRLRRGYAVREGIPVLLVDEATDVPEDEHERLTAKAAAGGAVETGHRGQPAAPGGSGQPAAPEGSGPAAATGGSGHAAPPGGGGRSAGRAGPDGEAGGSEG
jgi:uncharacterized protein